MAADEVGPRPIRRASEFRRQYRDGGNLDDRLVSFARPAMSDSPCARRASPRGSSADATTDHDLLQRMQGGDETALELLYARYAGLVYTLARRIVGDPELAQEVLQTTFLHCWAGAEGYDPSRGRVAWWLMGISRNRAIDLLRSRPHQARLREVEALPRTGSAHEPTQRDRGDEILLRHAVSAALAELSAAQRETIELAYYGGLTQSEIAQELQEPLGTVKSRTREGLDRLRGLLWPLVQSTEEAVGPRE